jgi:ppGpp synthetase/RelA/SpoT-type nucleotidyltranferase
MQDIGGCRAILGSVDELRVVEKRIRHRRPPVDYSDYIAAPRTSGYRALHLVVEYSGRKIEIQLRTRAMHEWALTVERLSSRVSRNLKGEGEHVLQRLMAVISDAMALEEAGQHVDTRLQSRIVELRESAKPYLSGGS